jgi:hypothetical protein
MSDDATLIQAALVVKGDYLRISARPYKIYEVKVLQDGHYRCDLTVSDGHDPETKTSRQWHQSHCFTAIDISTGNQREFVYNYNDTVKQLTATETTYQLCSHLESDEPTPLPKCQFSSIVLERLDDGTLRYLCSLIIEGELHKDLIVLSNKVGAGLMKATVGCQNISVTIVKAMGIEHIVAFEIVN